MPKCEYDVWSIWVIDAINYHGRSATILEISKHIWNNHSLEIFAMGDLVYEWQYEFRWIGTELRNNGILKPAKGEGRSPRGIWELA